MGRHNHRNDLPGEHPFGDTGQLIFLFIFLAAWIVDSFILKYSTFVASYVSLFIRIPFAVVILIISGYLAKQGMSKVFGETKDEFGVINKGVFALVRHPVYLGCILFYLGLTVLTFSIFSAIIWVIIIVFYHYIANYEERLLLNKYGKDYEAYKKSVPMWIPWTKSK